MARLARVILVNFPHHIIQRGNKRQDVFFFSNGRKWLLRAVAYVELNPVKAGMVDFAWDYPWSSVHAYLSGNDAFGLVSTEKMLNLTGDWKRYSLDAQSHGTEDFAKHEKTGRSLGGENFIEMAESLLKRDLKKRILGRKYLLVIIKCYAPKILRTSK